MHFKFYLILEILLVFYIHPNFCTLDNEPKSQKIASKSLSAKQKIQKSKEKVNGEVSNSKIENAEKSKVQLKKPKIEISETDQEVLCHTFKNILTNYY